MCMVVNLCTKGSLGESDHTEAPMEAKKTTQRKSLAVDQETYDLLQELCMQERRSKVDQLRMLIEREHARIFGERR